LSITPARRALVVSTGVLLGALALPIAAAAGPTIQISAGLDPIELRVRPGTTVTFRNVDGERHRLRSRAGAEFDTGNIEPGQARTIRFTVTGRYPYVDERDRDTTQYHGTIVVTASGATGGGASGSGGIAEPASSATIHFAGRRFAPSAITVRAGAVVTFRNDDDRAHTASATDDSFDTSVLAAGASARATLAKPGTYRYLCLIHPDMTGTITVKSTSGGAAPAPATPAPAPTPTPTPTPQSSPATVSGATVTLAEFAFTPAHMTVAAGATLTFRNDGAALHTATSDDGAIDSGYLEPGASFRTTLSQPGTVRFVCSLHPQMAMTVTVAAGGVAAPSASPPAPSPTSTPDASEDPSATPGILEAGVGIVGPSHAASADAEATASTDAAAVDTGPAGRVLLAILLTGIAVAAFARLVAGTGRPSSATAGPGRPGTSP
jgi:plastocyanin